MDFYKAVKITGTIVLTAIGGYSIPLASLVYQNSEREEIFSEKSKDLERLTERVDNLTAEVNSKLYERRLSLDRYPRFLNL